MKPQAGSRRKIDTTDFHAAGVVYLPDEARFSHLLSLLEGANVGQAVNVAMRAIKKENPDLADARHIYRQLDCAHRDFTHAQFEFLANIVRLYRGEPCEFHDGSEG